MLPKNNLEKILKKSAAFLAPDEFLTKTGGSANRMRQTYSLLICAGWDVDVLIVNQSNSANISSPLSKKKADKHKIVLPKNYHLIFCNYLFILEKIDKIAGSCIVCDIHDDLIDRDARLKADWFSRSIEEVGILIDLLDPLLIHISPVECRRYQTIFPKSSNYLLPYVSEQQEVKHPQDRVCSLGESEYFFGFIGTQNGVNANALVAADEVLSHISWEERKKLLVVGNLVNGISSAPDNMKLMSNMDTSKFYGSIDCLLLPILDQTGASTKLIEALTFEKLVLCTSTSWEGVGLEGGSRLPSDMQGIEDLANADLSELIELKLWQQKCFFDFHRKCQNDSEALLNYFEKKLGEFE